MSEPIESTSGSAESVGGVVSATAPAGEAPQPHGGANVQTSFSSMNDLREKYPKLYEQMTQGIAMNVCRSMQRSQDRLAQEMRRARYS